MLPLTTSPTRDIMRELRIAFALAVSMLMQTASADEGTDVGNWFNDPFFQVRSAIANCPLPLGPLLTRDAARQESHYRAERGTSCYLSGECKKPNAYLYDPDIAAAVTQKFAQQPELLQHSSLWVTVKRRFVWIEGCRAKDESTADLEALIKTIPDVQMVLVNVTGDPSGHLPYSIPIPPAR